MLFRSWLPHHDCRNGSSGESVGRSDPSGGFGEKAAEFAAGGLEGSLVVFGVAMIEKGSVIFKECVQEIGDGFLPEFGSFLKIANHLAAKQPEIVDVFLDGLSGKPGFGKVKKEG